MYDRTAGAFRNSDRCDMEKASNNAFANSFSDFLFSNQAVINAEYVK